MNRGKCAAAAELAREGWLAQPALPISQKLDKDTEGSDPFPSLPYEPGQSFLLPPSPMEWLPEDHFASFVLEVVGRLELGSLYSTKIKANASKHKAMSYERMKIVAQALTNQPPDVEHLVPMLERVIANCEHAPEWARVQAIPAPWPGQSARRMGTHLRNAQSSQATRVLSACGCGLSG